MLADLADLRIPAEKQPDWDCRCQCQSVTGCNGDHTRAEVIQKPRQILDKLFRHNIRCLENILRDQYQLCSEQCPDAEKCKHHTKYAVPCLIILVQRQE